MKILEKSEMKAIQGGARVVCKPTRAGRDTYLCCATDHPEWACWYQVDVR
jgi:hypothetical protein